MPSIVLMLFPYGSKIEATLVEGEYKNCDEFVAAALRVIHKLPPERLRFATYTVALAGDPRLLYDAFDISRQLRSGGDWSSTLYKAAQTFFDD